MGRKGKAKPQLETVNTSQVPTSDVPDKVLDTTPSSQKRTHTPDVAQASEEGAIPKLRIPPLKRLRVDPPTGDSVTSMRQKRQQRPKGAQPTRTLPARGARLSNPRGGAKPTGRRTSKQVAAEREAKKAAELAMERSVEEKIQLLQDMNAEEDLEQEHHRHIDHIFDIVPDVDDLDLPAVDSDTGEDKMLVEDDDATSWKGLDASDEDGVEAIDGEEDSYPFDEGNGSSFSMKSDDEVEFVGEMTTRQAKQSNLLKRAAEALRTRGLSGSKMMVEKKESRADTAPPSPIKKPHPTGLIANFQSKLIPALDSATATGGSTLKGITMRAVGKKPKEAASTAKADVLKESIRKRQRMGEIPRNNELVEIIEDPTSIVTAPVSHRGPLKAEASVISLKSEPSIVILSRLPSPIAAPPSKQYSKLAKTRPTPAQPIQVASFPTPAIVPNGNAKAKLSDLPVWMTQGKWQDEVIPTLMDDWCSSEEPYRDFKRGHLDPKVKAALDITVPGHEYTPRWGDVFCKQASYRISDRRSEVNRHISKAVANYFAKPIFSDNPELVKQHAKWGKHRKGPAFYKKPVPYEKLNMVTEKPVGVYESDLIRSFMNSFLNNPVISKTLADHGPPKGLLAMACAAFDFHFSRWETGVKVNGPRFTDEAVSPLVDDFMETIRDLKDDHWEHLLECWGAPTRTFTKEQLNMNTVGSGQSNKMHIDWIPQPTSSSSYT